MEGRVQGVGVSRGRGEVEERDGVFRRRMEHVVHLALRLKHQLPNTQGPGVLKQQSSPGHVSVRMCLCACAGRVMPTVCFRVWWNQFPPAKGRGMENGGVWG